MMNLHNRQTDRQKQLAVLTFGCQMNKYDSEMISGILAADQYQETDDLSKADVILLNTCSIREKAAQKVYSQIGRLRPFKEKNPGLIIGVGGCVGQIEGEKLLKRSPLVDLVFGTSNISRLPELLREIENTGKRIAEVGEPGDRPESGPELQRKGGVNAWVSIMQGCNNYCTYCIVPYARGRERSRPSTAIISEIRQLANKGCREVTLLGQNVNSYGKDTHEEDAFPELLKEVNGVEGINRIRFVTSHPKDFSLSLIDAIAGLDKVCESVHLPIQSGSDRVLRMMNRKYTVRDYLEKLETAKEKIPHLTVTSDIIVGFPGESDEDFLRTKEMVKGAQYDSVFLFKYSRRPETAAASFENQIPEAVKQGRFEEILALQNEISMKKNRAYEGKNVEVLVEGSSKTNPSKMTGRTRANKIVHFFGGEEVKPGQFVQVKIARGRVYGLEGAHE